MTTSVHPLAAVDSGAELGDGVVVGPFCVVEGGARIGARTVLRSHVVVTRFAELGEENDIFPHTTLGLDPQDLKFQGEATRLVVGSRNVVRENCTLHRGSAGGGGITRLGDDNLMQVGAHIAHDCQVGSGTVLGHQSSLAGHVDVGDHAWVGAYSAVHQFCRVGPHAFLGGFTVVTMDALPFMKTVGTREVKSYGPNSVGLQRKGFSEEAIAAIGKAHRILFRKDLPLQEALDEAERELGSFAEVALLCRFIREAKRGVHRG
jgi:UDP-N-acetylglucosamine acyltransferase